MRSTESHGACEVSKVVKYIFFILEMLFPQAIPYVASPEIVDFIESSLISSMPFLISKTCVQGHVDTPTLQSKNLPWNSSG